MRLARAVLLALIAAIVVIIAVVAVLPHELDWNRYRGSFEVLAGDALGRPVTIAGPIKLSLLPEPVLTASRVAIGASSGARITVAELRLQVALIPLLSGEVDARSLILKNPVLHLAWPPPAGAGWTIPPWLGTLSAEIDDGTIEVGTFRLTHINATLSAGQKQTALRIVGSTRAAGGAWQFEANLSEPEQSGEQALTARLAGTGHSSGTTLQFKGSVDQAGYVAGQMSAASAKLSQLFAAPALPLHANAALRFSAGRILLTHLSVALGGVSASGAGALTLVPAPRLDLALASTGTVPLDPWFDALRSGGESRLPVALSLTSPRAELAHGLLENVTLAVVLGPSGARIGAFRAILPGEARIALDGRIDRTAAKEAAWQFTGTVRLGAPRLAVTLHWLDAAAPHLLPPLPEGVLSQANFTARVSANASGVALDDINGTIGPSHVKGGARFGFGKHASVSAGLSLDKLGLDPWLEAAPRSLASFTRALGGASIQLRLAVARATLGRAVINGLSLDAAATPTALIVRRLDATSDGTHAIASGTIGADGTVTAASLALTAPTPALLTHLLPRPFGSAFGRWPAALSLSAHAAGPAKQLAVKIDATLGDLRITAEPTLNLSLGTWQGSLTLRYPDATKFFTLSGLGQRVGWLGPGSLSLIAHAASGAGGVTLKDFRLVAGALTASGSLAVVPGASTLAINGTIHANTLPLPLPRANGSAPLPFSLFEGWHGTIGFTADRAVGIGRPLLEKLNGQVSDSGSIATIMLEGTPPGGGSLGLSLAFVPEARPPTVKLGAALHNVVLKGGLSGGPLDLASGVIDAGIQLTGKGYSAGALLATLGGSVHLSAVDGQLSGLNLDEVGKAFGVSDQNTAKRELTDALSGGNTHFEHLVLGASVAHGRFVLGPTQLRSGSGEITASGSFDLPAQSLNLTLRAKPALAGAPAVTVRLAGAATKPKRLTEASAALAWLAAREASAKNGKDDHKASAPPAPTARAVAH